MIEVLTKTTSTMFIKNGLSICDGEDVVFIPYKEFDNILAEYKTASTIAKVNEDIVQVITYG